MLCWYYLNVGWHHLHPALKSTLAHYVLPRTPHYPGEDEKLRASNISRRRGGNCPNTLEVLQQLTAHSPSQTGASLNLIAVLPAKSSIASQQIQSAFEPRVQLAHCIYREQYAEPASSYIIKSQSSGSRTIVNYNELPEMTVDEFKRIADDLGPKATWFHFEVGQPFSDSMASSYLWPVNLGSHTWCHAGLYKISSATVSIFEN